jgi:DNA-binding NarL/FixJ family response regulator
MNIVIIDQNIIYRESLKTALDQIPDFNVVWDTDNSGYLETINNVHADLILIDYSDFVKINGNELMLKAVSQWPGVKFLLLTTYKEERALNTLKPIDVILKNSTKKEFENKIKKLQ